MIIDFSVLGEDTAALHIDEVGLRAADVRPALRQVQELIFFGEAKQFASQGSFFGSRWQPLAESTVAQKGSSQILVDTGELRDSLTRPTRKSRITRTQLSVKSSLWYAHFAKGTSHQPARQIVAMPAVEVREALQLILRYLVRGLV